jgi:hypothetical protein
LTCRKTNIVGRVSLTIISRERKRLPLARLEIEQLEGNRWVAVVEAGGFRGQRNFEHKRLHATSYEGIMSAVSEFFYRQVPPVAPKAPEPEPEPTPLQEAMSQAKAEARDDPREAEPHDDERAALREEAEALGIEYDRRWGAKRLHAEITKAKAGETLAGE